MIDRAFVKTSHGRVHYRECGEGPPLLLLHQTADSSLAFEPLMPGLVGHRLLATDTLGYGDSDPPPHPYSMEEYADSVVAFLDAVRREDRGHGQSHGCEHCRRTRRGSSRPRNGSLSPWGLPITNPPEREAKLAHLRGSVRGQGGWEPPDAGMGQSAAARIERTPRDWSNAAPWTC